jgi:hypothetical protein
MIDVFVIPAGAFLQERGPREYNPQEFHAHGPADQSVIINQL